MRILLVLVQSIFLATVAASVAILPACEGTTRSGTKYTQTFPTRSLQVRLPYELLAVHEAAVDVLKNDFGFAVNREAHDALEGVIKASTARNDKVTVDTFKEGDRVTNVKVWVGPYGDKIKAEAILNKIEAKLSEGGVGAAAGTGPGTGAGHGGGAGAEGK
jgi:hypothetical protein